MLDLAEPLPNLNLKVIDELATPFVCRTLCSDFTSFRGYPVFELLDRWLALFDLGGDLKEGFESRAHGPTQLLD